MENITFIIMSVVGALLLRDIIFRQDSSLFT